MNKRIQELAEQANAWYPGGYPIDSQESIVCRVEWEDARKRILVWQLVLQRGEGGDKAWKNVVIFQKEEDLQKFAELIVKECRVALSPILRDMISRGQAYELIKKHFGVEE